MRVDERLEVEWVDAPAPAQTDRLELLRTEEPSYECITDAQSVRDVRDLEETREDVATARHTRRHHFRP
jgi:hypothetical protein